MSAAIPKVSYGMSTFFIKQNDTQPSITFTCVDESQQMVPITGATGVQFRYRLQTAAPGTGTTKAATIVAADSGELRYDWVAADTVTPGDYYGEWIVSFPSGGQRTFPVDNYQPFTITADL